TWFHNPTCLVSLPLSGSVFIEGKPPIEGITHAFSISTPPAGLAGQLVYAGQGTEEDLSKAGAAGKIVLTEGLATPNKAHAATRAGALAVICISGTPVHEMIVSPVWGSPTPETMSLIPQVAMVSVTNEDGERLKE